MIKAVEQSETLVEILLAELRPGRNWMMVISQAAKHRGWH
jgi:hypothetical protein